MITDRHVGTHYRLPMLADGRTGGRVDVEVFTRDDAVVTVSDTGNGIPGGALDRVFEPFYTTRPDRAGLGLAIAWRTAALNCKRRWFGGRHREVVVKACAPFCIALSNRNRRLRWYTGLPTV